VEQRNEIDFDREEVFTLLPIIQMKICSKCKIEKPKSNFSGDARANDGLYSQCKDCHNKCCNRRNATYKGKEKIKKYQQSSNVKEVRRGYVYRRLYGITLEDYNRMLKSQGGVCAICGTSVPGGTGRFHVDHDHATNRARGILCVNCNRMLGNARDNIDVLGAGIKYLNGYNSLFGGTK